MKSKLIKTMKTPNKDYFYGKMEQLDGFKHSNTNTLSVGDFAYVPRIHGSITGFVKKVAKVNVTLEVEYGGWADDDIRLLEIQVRKNEIHEFMKPKLVTA